MTGRQLLLDGCQQRGSVDGKGNQRYSETEKLKRGVASDAERRGDRRRQDEEEEVV